MLEIMAVSVALGYLRRGSLRPLVQLPLRMLYLTFVALAIQAGIFSYWPDGLGDVQRLKPLLHLLSYALITFAVWFNRQIAGFSLIGAGMMLNFTVIALNGGHMPAIASNLAKIGYPEAAALLTSGQMVNNSVLLDSGTRLGFLGDIFYLPGPFPSPNVFSVGDIFIAAGIFLFLQIVMKSETVGGG